MNNLKHIAIINETTTEIELFRSGFSHFDSAVFEIQTLLESTKKNIKIGTQILTPQMSEAEVRQRVRDPK